MWRRSSRIVLLLCTSFQLWRRENRPSVPASLCEVEKTGPLYRPSGGYRREMPSSVPARGGGAGPGRYSRGLFSARAVRRPGFPGAPRFDVAQGTAFTDVTHRKLVQGAAFLGGRSLNLVQTPAFLGAAQLLAGPWLRPRYFRAYGRAAEQSHRLLRAPPRREERQLAAHPHFLRPRCKPETKARYDGGVNRALAPRRGPRHEHRLP